MTNDSQIIDRLGGEIYKFTFGVQSYEVRPSEDLPINDADLSIEFVKQPSLYAYVAIIKAKADSALKHAKVELEEAEAKASEKIRTRYELEHRKTTEGMINSAVSIDPDVMKSKRELLNKQSDYAILDALESALKMRADMLIKLGSLQQAEWTQTGMNTKNNPSAAMKNALTTAKKINGGNM